MLEGRNSHIKFFLIAQNDLRNDKLSVSLHQLIEERAEIERRCSGFVFYIQLRGKSNRPGEVCISCARPSLTPAPFTAVTPTPPPCFPRRHHHHLVNKGQAIRHLEGQLICHPSTNVSVSDLVHRA